VLTKHRIENLGPSLMFSIQLPPPVLGAICASARIHLADEIGELQRELAERLAFARVLLRADPVLAPRSPMLDGAPTPVHYVVLGNTDRTIAAASRLIERGFLVNPVAFPAVPIKRGGIRFSISRCHTEADIRALIGEISAIASERSEAAPVRARTTTRDLGVAC